MQRTLKQNRQLFYYLNQAAIDSETRADLIYDFSNGRTTHSAELRYNECKRLINSLRQMLSGSAAMLDRKRKRVISHMKEAGYVLPDGQADMHAIYSWALKQKRGKSLNRMNGKELSELIYAAEKVKEHFLIKKK